MKKIEHFPHMLNQMFSELNAASKIVISCTIPSTHHTGLENGSPRLTGVNGCNSVTTFTDYLYSLKAGLLETLSEELPELDVQVRRMFIHQVILRCRSYACITSPLETDDYPVNKKGYQQIRWGFHKPVFNPGEGPQPDVHAQKILLSLTSRYAYVWRLIGEELLDELHWLHCHATFLPVLNHPPDRKPAHEKIPLKDNVAELGAMARLFYDNNAIDLDNKTLFCKLIADMFSTPRQKDISPRSLKNHFDCPSLETMDQLREELRQMLNNSQAYYDIA
jgi:hypothetical protein